MDQYGLASGLFLTATGNEYRRSSKRRTRVGVTSIQKVSHSLDTGMEHASCLNATDAVPNPPSGPKEKCYGADQAAISNGKEVGMAAGDPVPAWNPAGLGAVRCRPHTASAHTSTPEAPHTVRTLSHLPFSLSQKRRVPLFSQELAHSLFSTCHLFLSIMILQTRQRIQAQW